MALRLEVGDELSIDSNHQYVFHKNTKKEVIIRKLSERTLRIRMLKSWERYREDSEETRSFAIFGLGASSDILLKKNMKFLEVGNKFRIEGQIYVVCKIARRDIIIRPTYFRKKR